MIKNKKISFFVRIANAIRRRIYCLLNLISKKRLQRKKIWHEIEKYSKNSPFPERYKYYVKYLTLYNSIRKHKPQMVLECGMGITTLIIAYALMENGSGELTSMEENREYADKLTKLIPKNLKYNLIVSERTEDYHNQYRGVRYKDTPIKEYDFIFIDGPTTTSLTDGTNTFDFDLLKIMLETEHSFRAIIDNRISTYKVIKEIFNQGVRFDYIRRLAFIKR